MIWTVIVIAALLLCFGTFTWAMKYFFRSPDRPAPAMRVIAIAGLLSVVIQAVVLWFGAVRPSSAIPALVMYGSALALFAAAITANRAKPLTLAFTEDAPEHLVAHGPYRWIRHPFYTSYTLAWLAGVVGSRQPLLLITVAVLFALYLRAALHEEKKFLAGPLRDRYLEYSSRTGRFFPRIL